VYSFSWIGLELLNRKTPWNWGTISCEIIGFEIFQ
jgi:hypothetical protein